MNNRKDFSRTQTFFCAERIFNKIYTFEDLYTQIIYNVLRCCQTDENIASLCTSGNLQFENTFGEDFVTQEAKAKLRKEMIKLQKELDNEKVYFFIGTRTKAKKEKEEEGEAERNTTSQRKVQRMESEVEKKDLEISTKQKKLDEMLLR
ncbi:hypothetical protein RFI_38070 [Reticulomyxa filosa]|uniref:Uncharacterized protein n=1 Tax=Reticulomyxa filosa TaxID=46433 RepID=X6LE89_RETFI|nr:hypothetical protein RFI_38070 [Reticulomyxa filosa]|eukprot:ETN99411.1 hypothetical protein RFI_38070 [Reticulomyxa filosa]